MKLGKEKIFKWMNDFLSNQSQNIKMNFLIGRQWSSRRLNMSHPSGILVWGLWRLCTCDKFYMQQVCLAYIMVVFIQCPAWNWTFHGRPWWLIQATMAHWKIISSTNALKLIYSKCPKKGWGKEKIFSKNFNLKYCLSLDREN